MGAKSPWVRRLGGIVSMLIREKVEETRDSPVGLFWPDPFSTYGVDLIHDDLQIVKGYRYAWSCSLSMAF